MIKIFHLAKENKFVWLLGILAVIIIFFLFAGFILGNSNFSRLLNWANPDNYQAVFLSNSQVYFGKAVSVNGDTLVLRDIYYLRMSDPLQAGSETEPESNFSLIKLGQELHGPEDKMSINVDQILFVEDLRDDSKVVQAIRDYQKK